MCKNVRNENIGFDLPQFLASILSNYQTNNVLVLLEYGTCIGEAFTSNSETIKACSTEFNTAVQNDPYETCK